MSLSSLLQGAAHADALQTGLAALLLGVLFHISIPIRHAEFEEIMLPFVGVACATFGGVLSLFATVGELSIIEALVQTATITVFFNAGLLLSIGIYRLFFHRLRHFPGPFAAKLTKFHAVYRSAKHTQLHREREELHKQYGDVVRVGPREVSILRKSAVPLLYGPTTDCRKSTWYAQAGTDTNYASLHMERSRASHRLRRRAWDRGFSQKGMPRYSPSLR